MQFRPLHDDFGIEVDDVDLKDVTAENGYGEIRDAFESHSLLLFRNQNLSDEEQLAFARLFGPLEDRIERPKPKICPVSNVTEDDHLTDADDRHTLHLKANQLWHTDSTFLPVPALANVLQARIVPSRGGETEFVSTRAGWSKLDPHLKAKAKDAIFWHRYAHSRAKVDPELAKGDLFTKWPDQAWRALWRNPVNGEDALYIASHVFAVEGWAKDAGAELVENLISAVTEERAIYRHSWQPGDIILWDERATLHRGRPWPYDEARTLVSICVSAQASDGLEGVRPPLVRWI
jgi:alpha-ketoglutarate-dependent 2,4-dichlorophenoxyacetate dioxygenase